MMTDLKASDERELLEAIESEPLDAIHDEILDSDFDDWAYNYGPSVG